MVDKNKIDTSVSTAWDNVRSQRALLLKMADNLVNKAIDNGVDESAFRTYRQELRDVTKCDSPYGVVWPTKPE